MIDREAQKRYNKVGVGMAATDTLLKGFLAPTTSRIDYAAITKAVQSAATGASKVTGPVSIAEYLPSEEQYIPTKPTKPTPPPPSSAEPLLSTGGGRHGFRYPEYVEDLWAYQKALDPKTGMPLHEREAAQMTGKGIVAGYETKREAMTKEAKKSAEALELMGMQTVTMLKNLGGLEEEVKGQYDTARGNWQKAIDQAEEYAKASPIRALASLEKLEEVNNQIATGRDFAKAHDAQAAAQSVIAASRGAVRQAAELYGAGSPEHRQAQESQKQSLAAAQSGIIGAYRRIEEAQNIAYMNASAETMWRGDMYTSFQEQQHVETIRYMAQSSQEYSLQWGQFQLGIEQLKAAGLENLANWLVQTPTYSMDVAPYLTALAGTIPTAVT